VIDMQERLGVSEEELADFGSEGDSDSSDHAASPHEQDHSSLFGNKVDWTEKDERDLNDLLKKTGPLSSSLMTSPSQQRKVRILKD
jgi:hypothetical protein